MTTSTRPMPVRIPAAANPPLIGRKAFVEMIMGLPVSVHVRAEDPGRDDIAAAVRNTFAVLHKADDLFSRWREDSEIRRLQRGLIAPGAAHEWQADVVALALEAEDVTDGLFSAWYAAPRYPGVVIPSGPAGSSRARRGAPAFGGYDPTGIVKGWAVEKAADMLRVVPRISFCLNAGGDMLIGAGRDMAFLAPTWRIGVESPSVPGTVAAVRSVPAGAVATSGAVARGAHILDPSTGVALNRAGSATVVGPSLTWADVWATAAFVDPRRASRLMASRAAAYELILLD